jgi:outer membrane protein
MNYLKNFLFILFIFFALSKQVFAELPVYLDFKFILNNSTAGKKAQDSLKKRLDNGIKSLNSKEKSIQEEERKIIQQKKIITQEEYVKKVNGLRQKVSSLQKERNKLLESVAKDRRKAKNELLKNLNPIIEAYMQEKKIRLVIDKKNIILADEKLDITKEIIKILNTKLQSIKLN